MGRTRGYNAGTKSITNATAQTIVFTPQDLPSDRLVRLHLTWTGTGNTLTTFSRLRVKANGVPIIDTTPTFLRAYIQRMTNGRIRYPSDTAMDALGTPGTPVRWGRLTIPLHDLRAPTEEMQDACQFPRGAQVSVEVVTTSGIATGVIGIGWTQTDIPGACYPRLISQQMGIAASVSNGRFNLSDEGNVRGLGLNTIGLTRARVVLAGAEVTHVGGQSVASATFTGDSLFAEVDQLDNAMTDIIAGTAANTAVLYNPMVIGISANRPAPQGSSFIEVGTDSNWAGVANEVFTYSEVPQG